MEDEWRRHACDLVSDEFPVLWSFQLVSVTRARRSSANCKRSAALGLTGTRGTYFLLHSINQLNHDPQ